MKPSLGLMVVVLVAEPGQRTTAQGQPTNERATAAASTGGCSSSYLPLQAGNTWQYDVTPGDRRLTLTVVADPKAGRLTIVGVSAAVDQKDAEEESESVAPLSVSFICQGGHLVVDRPEDSAFDPRLTPPLPAQFPGESFPEKAVLESTGSRWETRSTFFLGGVHRDEQVIAASKLVSLGMVTVETLAGAFVAARVERDTTISGGQSGVTTWSPTHSHDVIFLAEGVGVVKMVSADGSQVIALRAYSVGATSGGAMAEPAPASSTSLLTPLSVTVGMLPGYGYCHTDPVSMTNDLSHWYQLLPSGSNQFGWTTVTGTVDSGGTDAFLSCVYPNCTFPIVSTNDMCVLHTDRDFEFHVTPYTYDYLAPANLVVDSMNPNIGVEIEYMFFYPLQGSLGYQYWQPDRLATQYASQFFAGKPLFPEMAPPGTGVFPFRGDQVAVMGQLVWDCGHEYFPYGFKTEIHPPVAAAWMHLSSSPINTPAGTLYVKAINSAPDPQYYHQPMGAFEADFYVLGAGGPGSTLCIGPRHDEYNTIPSQVIVEQGCDMFNTSGPWASMLPMPSTGVDSDWYVSLTQSGPARVHLLVFPKLALYYGNRMLGVDFPVYWSGACPCGYCQSGATCVSLSQDVSNCGTCGHVCPGTANGYATCSAGTCSYACNAGYTDCGSGVCTNLLTDAGNCGSCGYTCSYGCSNGRCNCGPGTLRCCGDQCLTWKACQIQCP